LSRFVTRLGSLDSYEKGRVEVIDDDPRHSALVMDGQVVVELRELSDGQRPEPDSEGSRAVQGSLGGRPMGRITAGRGHMVLLPAGAAYRMSSVDRPGVVLVQTIAGPGTLYRWGEICQTS
jgi:hypothetical protein